MVMPRKSDKQKQMAGTYRRDRSMSTPEPTGSIGDPPKYFNDDHIKAWAELVDLVPEGVLFKSDRLILELTCTLMVKQRSDGLTSGEVKHYMGCLSKLGLSPADRTKVPVTQPKPETENKFSKFK